METDCCESLRSSAVSRRAVLLGGASFAAWAYLPKFARAADGRDPRLVVIILRGALDGLATVAPIGVRASDVTRLLISPHCATRIFLSA